MAKGQCVYTGAFLVDASNPHFTENNNFTLDVLERIFDEPDIEFEEPEDDAYEALSLVSRYVELTDGTSTCNEWRVFHNGQWVDTVFFDETMDSADAREELVAVDHYPSDILLLKIEK